MPRTFHPQVGLSHAPLHNCHHLSCVSKSPREEPTPFLCFALSVLVSLRGLGVSTRDLIMWISGGCSHGTCHLLCWMPSWRCPWLFKCAVALQGHLKRTEHGGYGFASLLPWRPSGVSDTWSPVSPTLPSPPCAGDNGFMSATQQQTEFLLHFRWC